MNSPATPDASDRRQFMANVVGNAFTVAGVCAAGKSLAFPGSPAFACDVANGSQELYLAITKAVDFLLRRRGDDGLWRSKVYGPFHDVTALTPRILSVLSKASELSKATDVGLPAQQQQIVLQAVRAGRKWAAGMLQMRDESISVRPLAYPVYFAADVVSLLSNDADAASRQAWQAYLRNLQLSPELGWEAGDPRCGGWSYAKARPQRPTVIEQLSPLSEPNISATVAALDALSHCDKSTTEGVRRRALAFVCRLQNRDGGFRFVLDDFVRNKAGASERADGVAFHSYGSATCDGLRGLLHCGLGWNDARVVKARRWLERNFNADSHPGQYSDERKYSREAVYYYYCRSLSVGVERFPSLVRDSAWLGEIASRLVARQRDDGAWSNPVVDVREDDPLVATPLALEALLVRQSMVAAAGDGVASTTNQE